MGNVWGRRMKITEISARIMNVLHEKEFIGEFEVTICHPDMADVKIAGQMKDVALGSDFSSKLQNKINEICFQIVSSDISDEEFTFTIKGQIAYLYTYGEEE